LHQLRLVPARLSYGNDQYFSTGHRTHIVDADGCIDCGICPPICPVHVIHEVADYTPPPEKLAAAKDKAKRYAANQRKMKLDRDAVVARTLGRLAETKAASHA
jgi:ferredoxin